MLMPALAITEGDERLPDILRHRIFWIGAGLAFFRGLLEHRVVFLAAFSRHPAEPGKSRTRRRTAIHSTSSQLFFNGIHLFCQCGSPGQFLGLSFILSGPGLGL